MDASSTIIPTRHGAVGVIWRNEKLLVIKRSMNISAPGRFCFPGGGIEQGESEEMALIREMQEEIHSPVSPVRCVWRNVTRWGVSLAWWLAEMSDEVQPLANPEEVESIHWLTPEEMVTLPNLLDSNREFLQLAINGEINIR
jgi:8-oxo-dGTP diphosphatase